MHHQYQHLYVALGKFVSTLTLTYLSGLLNYLEIAVVLPYTHDRQKHSEMKGCSENLAQAVFLAAPGLH